MKTVLLIVSLGGLLAVAAVGAWYGWTSLDGVAISRSGIFAMVLGIVFATALGSGLMFLVFYSSRHGYDDDAGE